MTVFQLAALFLTLMAIVGWLNVRLFRLPPGVAMLLVGLAGGLALALLRGLAPDLGAGRILIGLIDAVDFPETVVGYMLGFLLFAGAMQVDLSELKRRRIAVFSMATLGVLACTLIVGFGMHLASRALGLELPLLWALVFGALISPTDPVAVLHTVRRGEFSKALQAILQGEALFNDGVGIVVFLALAALAVGGGGIGPGEAALRVAIEAGGGLIFGLVAGLVAIQAIKAIEDEVAEVGLSLALAAGTYAAAQAVHLSGPIAVVAAGLLMGDSGAKAAMSEAARHSLETFWSLVDEILNALLFLLLGLMMVVIPFDGRHLALCAVAIPLVLIARVATTAPWGVFFRVRHGERWPTLVLTWGGIHGALSLALALTLPAGEVKDLILSLTYAVVVFSVAVQGLTFAPLVQRLGRPAEPPA